MKKIISLAALAFAAVSCTPDAGNLKGTITGVETDTIMVQISNPADRGMSELDTIPMKNGKFSTKVADSLVQRLILFPKFKQNPDGSIKATSMSDVIQLVLIPGDKLEVNGSFKEYKVTGSPFYAELEKADALLQPLNDRFATLRNMFAKIDQSKHDSLTNVIMQTSDSILAAKVDYIKNNPNSMVSAYYVCQIPPVGKFVEGYNALSDEIKNGVFKNWLQNQYSNYEKFIAREKAKAAIAPGKPAPEFTLNDINGKPFALSSLRGKYVVLDFWGTWCGWCIKGIPEMKEAYAKYKGKLEIVGIDCGDTEEKWKAGVAEHQLPWINVMNQTPTDVTTQYAVSGYPTKAIIDPEGNIVEIVVGERPEFYEKLEELCGKKK